jgi:D-glycero-D-manno-heptose 1,7-bisphosphate phosphatase
MLPVAGQPFIEILEMELARQGIDEILVIAGFRGSLMEERFVDSKRVKVVVEPEPLGTGGAIRFAAEHLSPSFLFLNGDSLFDINLHDLMSVSDDLTAILALRQMPDISRYGPAELATNGRITNFSERPLRGGPGLINGGVGYFSRHILDWIPAGRAVSIEREVYPKLAAEGLLGGRVYDRPFIDIGIPADYALAQTQLPELLRRGAIIFDRDGVLNEDIAYAHRPDQVRWIEGAREAIKYVNDAGLLALVATNQAGIAHGHYTEQDMHILHRWMVEQMRALGANLDGIAHCPFHSEGVIEAYRQDSPMRKPAPGMLLALMADHGVNPARCVMIGDRDTDMAAAAAAGIDGVLFTSGSLLETVKPIVAQLAS